MWEKERGKNRLKEIRQKRKRNKTEKKVGKTGNERQK